MIDFTHLVNTALTTEAAELDLSAYIQPPPRAKFQAGDIVIVRDSRGKYSSYHSRRYLPYLNKVGKIISYRNVPGAYSKFTIEFADKNILPIHSQFIDGPFKDLKTALKYQDNAIPIETQDIKGAAVDAAWSTKPKMERELINMVTQPPLNFQLYDSPRFTVKDAYTECALAGDGVCELVRTNNTRTKKLYTSTPYHVAVPRIGAQFVKHGWTSGNNPLLGLPDISIMDILSPLYNQKEILALPQTYYHSKKLYQLFKQMDADTYQITDELFFHLMNEGLREEDNGWVLDLGQLKWHTWDKFYYNPRYLRNCNMFKNLTIIGGKVSAKLDDSSLIGSPKIVNDDFYIESSTDIIDYTGMPIVHGKMIGIDELLYKQFQINKAMSSVKNNTDVSKLFKKKHEL